MVKITVLPATKQLGRHFNKDNLIEVLVHKVNEKISIRQPKVPGNWFKQENRR